MRTVRSARPLVLVAVMGYFGAAAGAQEVHQPRDPASGTGFRDVVQAQNPTVVSISARTRVHKWQPMEETVFRMFGVVPPPADERIERVAASGVIISEAGEILTNNHVVEGADSIDVMLFGDDRTRYRAVRIGGDSLTDVALIRLVQPPPHLAIAVLADSADLAPGDWVLAIGNPFELGHTVTVGVVSFAHRSVPVDATQWRELIQTDASINPGNSGGPLINTKGEVVGINVAVLDDGMDGVPSIGFAVPINSVKDVLPQLRTGRVVRGYVEGLQLHVAPIRVDEARELGLPRPLGVIVRSVDHASAAGRAGLRAGDVIVTMDGRIVADGRAFLARTAAARPGSIVALEIIRDRIKTTRRAVVDELPIETSDTPPAVESGQNDGLRLDDLTPSAATDRGVPTGGARALVVEVVPDSAADDAGLIAGDIVMRINRTMVHSAADVRDALAGLELNRPIFLLIWRDGIEVFLEMRRD